MKHLLLIIFLFLSLAIKAQLLEFNPIIEETPKANSELYKPTCLVQYETSEGWSKHYEVTVTFLSGTSLNRATETYNYSTLSIYGVIFWGNNRATVIKITTYIPCAPNASSSCINRVYGPLIGIDQEEDQWRIYIN